MQNITNTVIWSDKAVEEYGHLQQYLHEEWGDAIAEKVVNDIADTIKRIQNSPEHFPVFYKAKNIRRCVASPQTSIFFRFTKNTVEIVSIFDNRQNPKKLNKLK